MIDFEHLLDRLRKKPYATRVKILWTTTVCLAVILAAIWVWGLKGEINNLEGRELINLPDLQGSLENEEKLVTIERVEQSASGFKIFFSVKNNTNDILNFSRAEEVTLKARDATYNPTQLLDRQNRPFVQKILSHTENFGTLVFSKLDAHEATLTFEDLYFEKTPQTILKETITLDIEKLKKDQSLRE